MSEHSLSGLQESAPHDDQQPISEDEFDALFCEDASVETAPELTPPSINEDDFLGIIDGAEENKQFGLFRRYLKRKYEDIIYIIKLYDLSTPVAITGIMTLIFLLAGFGYMVINFEKEQQYQQEQYDAAIKDAADKTADGSAQTPPEGNGTTAASPNVALDANTQPPSEPVLSPDASQPAPTPIQGRDPDAEVIKPAPPLPPPPGQDDLLARLLHLEDANGAPDSATMAELQNDPNKVVVDCLLEHNNIVVLRAPCTFSRSRAGYFMMTNSSQFQVVVSGTGNVRQIYWDNMMRRKNFKERGSISPDADDKACWSSETVRICAWR